MTKENLETEAQSESIRLKLRKYSEEDPKRTWKKELLFLTTLLANLVSIGFFLLQLFKNGV